MGVSWELFSSLRRFLQGAAETKEPVVISKSRRLLGAPISYGVNVAEITTTEALTRFGLTQRQLRDLAPAVRRGYYEEETIKSQLELKKRQEIEAQEQVERQRNRMKRFDRELIGHTNVLKVIGSTPSLQDCFHYDKFADQTIVDRNPSCPEGIESPVFDDCPRPMCDLDVSVVLYWCEAHGFSPSPAMVDRAIKDYASSKGVHPVREYLESLEWDGKPRVTGWLTRYMGVKFETYSAMVGRYWLVSAVARVFEPGCQADHVLILEGKQGVGKSSATRILSVNRKWHFDSSLNLSSKETPMLLQGKWIVEFQELGAMRRAEGERIKEFFTQHTDKYMKKYSNNETVMPRQCVFIATVNHSQYLQDDTGNRRFWPVVVDQVKFRDLQEDVDQLWAEAHAIYKAGLTCQKCELPWRCDEHRWHPTAEEQLMWFSGEQEKRVPEDLWHTAISRWMTGFNRKIRSTGTPEHMLGRWPTTSEVLTGALQIPIHVQERVHEIRAGRVLRLLGYELQRRKLENQAGPDVRQYVWEPSDTLKAITEMAEEQENERKSDGVSNWAAFGRPGGQDGGRNQSGGDAAGLLPGQGGQGKDPVGEGSVLREAGGPRERPEEG